MYIFMYGITQAVQHYKHSTDSAYINFEWDMYWCFVLEVVSSDEVVRVDEHRVDEHRVEEHRASDADSIVGSHSSVSSRHSTGSLSAVTAAFGKSGASTPSSSRKSSHSGECYI